MKTGPGSPARLLAYQIDVLIIARFAHFAHFMIHDEQSATARKRAVDLAVEDLEKVIGEVL